MKFVCDNCKAKYQIGDDKVAGKTLRMKCRRCGHMIQVAATVTESSVSQKLPTEPAAGSVPAPLAGSTPQGMLEGSSEDGATIVRPSPLFLFDHKTADRPAPVPPAPTPSVPGAPPRPGAGTGNIPRPAGIGAPVGGAPRIVPPARPSLRNSSAPQAIAPRDSNPPPAAPMHSPSSPGLHSGFQAAVAAPVGQPSSPPGAAPLPTEDWYVGVGGVPLGPVRLSIVREKAANGQVDQESLVWREGFDEWLPIKSFPALSALVDEVKQQRISRTSAPTPSPSAALAPSQLGFTPGTVPVAAAPTPAPAPAVDLRSSSNQAARNPFAAQPAQAGSLAAAARALAASAPAPSNAGSLGSPRMSTPSVPEAAPSIPFDLTRQSQPPVAPLFIKDPFGPAHSNGATNGSANGATNGSSHGSLAPPEAASTGMGYGMTTTAAVAGPGVTTAPRLDSLPPPSEVTRKKKGVHPMVWAFVAMAAAFGGVAAWALFLRKPDIVYVPKEGEVVAAQPGGAAPPPPPSGAVAGTAGTADVTASPTDSAVAIGGPIKGGGQLPPGVTAKPGETAAPLDTSGFGPGPGPGPGPNPTSGGGKGALNESQLNGVVSSNSPRVRRKCWDPLVSGRSSNAPNSVKVTATVKIGPSGAVKSVSTSGGNEQYYPGLTSCVQSTVNGWSFPPSDEGGTVVVPFGFNAQ